CEWIDHGSGGGVGNQLSRRRNLVLIIGTEHDLLFLSQPVERACHRRIKHLLIVVSRTCVCCKRGSQQSGGGTDRPFVASRRVLRRALVHLGCIDFQPPTVVEVVVQLRKQLGKRVSLCCPGRRQGQ